MNPFQVYTDARGAIYMVGGLAVSFNAAGTVDFSTAAGPALEIGAPPGLLLRAAAGLGALYVAGGEAGGSWLDVTADATLFPLVLGLYYEPDTGTYYSLANWQVDFVSGTYFAIRDGTGSVVADSTVSSASMAATAYGQTTYNGGAAFNVYAPPGIPPYAPIVDLWLAAEATSAQLGNYALTAGVSWADTTAGTWRLELDAGGSGEGKIYDPANNVVAIRPPDASLATDPQGIYVATPYGIATWSTAVPVTTGAINDGDFTDQAYAFGSTAGTLQTWPGVTDATLFLTWDTSTGIADLNDAGGIVATRAINDAVTIDGLYDAAPYGIATYGQAAQPWTYTVGTYGLKPFVIEAGRIASAAKAGTLYVLLALDGSNQVTGLTGPFFDTSPPGNTSTQVTVPIARSDGLGNVVQIQTGAILWQP